MKELNQVYTRRSKMNRRVILSAVTHHLDVFRQFLKGGEVQFFSATLDSWISVETPEWYETMEYRINPKKEFEFESNKTKEITYFGKKLLATADHSWIATNGSGKVYSYNEKPTFRDGVWVGELKHHRVAKFKNTDNEELSLMEI